MNRTTLAAALSSFALGILAGWLIFADTAPTVPEAKYRDLQAAAAALADENASLAAEVELREKIIHAQRERLDLLQALVDEQPKAL